MKKVLGLGDNVCDVYLHTGIMYPGGQALNFAVYAKQCGMEADYMGVHGDDAIAAHILKTLDTLGIGHSHSRQFPGENGFARVTLEQGDRVFKGSNRGGVLQSHPITIEKDDEEYIASFALVHTTNNGFTDALLPKIASSGVPVSYDFSFRWNEEDRVMRVCPHITYAFVSCSGLDDGKTRALCERLHREGAKTVTATRGSLGALVYDGVRFYTQMPDYVEPKDTMGAGDSFAAAMLTGLLQQKPMEEALAHAAAFSAKTCLTDGAFGYGIPVPQELHARIFDETEGIAVCG